MKNFISYFDILLSLIVIVIAIFFWWKYHDYSKKRDEDFYKDGKKGSYYAIIQEVKAVWIVLSVLIVGSIVFIYNRLNGNLPNIIILLNKWTSY